MQAREGSSALREGGEDTLLQYHECRAVPFLFLWEPWWEAGACARPRQHGSWEAPSPPSLTDVPRVTLVGEKVGGQSPVPP